VFVAYMEENLEYIIFMGGGVHVFILLFVTTPITHTGLCT
jgi:hypothetical protein